MSFHRILNLKCFLVLFMLNGFTGCTGTLDHVDLDPQTVGYQADVPKAGTRVVVWGNHSMAVDNASMWFHQRGLVVLDRTKIQQGLNDKGVRLMGSSKDWAHVLEAGKTIGADLVTFVEVSNIKEGQKFALSQITSAPTFSLTVEIRGVRPETGEIVTKSKAWQTGPAQDSDFVIEDLTARALVGAWKSETSDLEVIAINKVEAKEEDGMIQQSLPILALRSSNDPESLEVNDSERSIALGDQNGKNHEEIIPEAPLRQRPDTVITSQNASTHEELAINPIVKPASSSTEHAMLETQEGSSTKPETGLTVAKTSPSQTELHNEDSTHLNRQEPNPAAKQSTDSSSDSVGSQIASGALSIFYTPAKLVYAGLGGIFGGLAYVLTAGDEQTADTIWAASLEGDYFLTPAHLRGDTPIHFMGSSSENSVVNAYEPKEPFVAHSSSFRD